MKKNASIIILILAVLLFLLFLSSGNKVPPVPADAVHNAAATDDACAACHGPGRQAPLRPGHPPKEQCLICHKRREAA